MAMQQLSRLRCLLTCLLLFVLGACASQKTAQVPTKKYVLSQDALPCSGQAECEEVCSKRARGLACLEVAMYTLTSALQDGRSIIANMTELLGQEPIRQAFQHAATQLRTECDNEEAVSCLALGNMHLEGLGILQDQASAIGLIQSACDLGVADGCTRIGMLYSEGIAVARDPNRARAFFEMSCTGGDPNGCRMLESLDQR